MLITIPCKQTYEINLCWDGFFKKILSSYKYIIYKPMFNYYLNQRLFIALQKQKVIILFG